MVVNLNQVIPNGATITDSGSGQIQNGILRWSMTIGPHQDAQLLQAFGQTSLQITMPAAQMTINDVGNTKTAVFGGEADPLPLHLPLSVQADPPGHAAPLGGGLCTFLLTRTLN